jgi:hypothetical protein
MPDPQNDQSADQQQGPWTKYGAAPPSGDGGPWSKYAGTAAPETPDPLETGEGMIENAAGQAQDNATRALKVNKLTGNTQLEEEDSPSLAGAAPLDRRVAAGMNPATSLEYGVERPSRAQNQAGTRQAVKDATSVLGATVLPGVAPEIGLLGRAGLAGVGAAAGNSVGQGITGEYPLSKDALEESGTTGATTGLTDLLLGAPNALARTKMGRSFINESLGATGRDVTYGNPANALLDNDIKSVRTGDIEKVKAAGGDLTKAGGPIAKSRLGGVSSKIEELQPQLQAELGKATGMIKVSDAIDKPLNDALDDIANDRAMTQSEKDAAVKQLGELQQSLKEGLGPDITAQQANEIKGQVGKQAEFQRKSAVPPNDRVLKAYRQVYGTLNDEINSVSPGAARINKQLTNLHAAQGDLLNLSRNEEVSRGAGGMRAKTGNTALGALESTAGRILPLVAPISRRAEPLAPLAAIRATRMLKPLDEEDEGRPLENR